MNTVIDFRDMLPRGRHTLFLTIFAGLKEGSSFEFINDHEPKRLFKEIENLQIEHLKWETIEPGPQAWKIRVTKDSGAGKPHEKSCCGVCGGE